MILLFDFRIWKAVINLGEVTRCPTRYTNRELHECKSQLGLNFWVKICIYIPLSFLRNKCMMFSYIYKQFHRKTYGTILPADTSTTGHPTTSQQNEAVIAEKEKLTMHIGLALRCLWQWIYCCGVDLPCHFPSGSVREINWSRSFNQTVSQLIQPKREGSLFWGPKLS
jgi:hypothetical protein